MAIYLKNRRIMMKLRYGNLEEEQNQSKSNIFEKVISTIGMKTKIGCLIAIWIKKFSLNHVVIVITQIKN